MSATLGNPASAADRSQAHGPEGSAATAPERIATAVALRYAQGDAAPIVVAKGRGLVAEEIIRRAHEAGVFVHESRDLVGLLMQVDLDRHIPPELFVAVAQLLAWIHRVEAIAALGVVSRNGN